MKGTEGWIELATVQLKRSAVFLFAVSSKDG